MAARTAGTAPRAVPTKGNEGASDSDGDGPLAADSAESADSDED
jgi:hypothetical protein